MSTARLPRFAYSDFAPREVAKIVGVTPAKIRTWRARNLIEAELDRGPSGYSLYGVAAVLLTVRLVDLGMAPSSLLGGWRHELSRLVAMHATASASAWESTEDFEAWQADVAGEPIALADGKSLTRQPHDPARRFAVILPGNVVQLVDDPLPHLDAAVATVINLESLGAMIRQRAGKPLARVSGWQELAIA